MELEGYRVRFGRLFLLPRSHKKSIKKSNGAPN